ncbi:hypothetical protein MD484_g4272, partial [Candolleomyces efflorescens]
MGKSAKLHKRVKKLKTPGGASSATGASTQAQAQAAKKKATLKDKTSKGKSDRQGPVLGGADYVSLLMGGRRKAREEAARLPMDED